jgi:hypothetical protein
LNILVGTLIYRHGAYVLDKFLANQQQIQQRSPQGGLVLATAEEDYTSELEKAVSSRGLRGTVLNYKVTRPPFAKSTNWNIAYGREAIRRYMLAQNEAEGLLFLDADMTYDPAVIGIMDREIKGYQVVFSGSPRKDFGTGLSGAGCLLLKREALEKLEFRCYEFKNGEVIYEDNVLEMDLFSIGARVKKGFFVSMSHYISRTEARHLEPRNIGVLRKLANNVLIRYCLIRFSIIVHYNIPEKLKRMIFQLTRVAE